MRRTNLRNVLLIAAGLSLGPAGGALRTLEAQEPTAHVALNPQERYQIMDGFGVNFNGVYFRDDQKRMMDLLIDDLGATLFRLDPYGVTSWETANDNDDPNVMNWEYYNDRYSSPNFEASWAAARHLNARGLRPFMTLSGTVPNWMLDDKAPPPKHHVCRGEAVIRHPWTGGPPHLNPAMYGEFAEEVVSMLVYARTKAHIDFDLFSPFNETDCYPVEGPRIDPDEAPKVLDTIEQRLRKEGLGDIRLVVADQANMSNDYIGPILQDTDLMKQVAVFSFHSYGSASLTPQSEHVRRSKYPGVKIWLTEYGDLNDQDRSLENDWKNFSLLATGRALRAINEGASAALFWDAFDNYQEHDARVTFYGLLGNSDHLFFPKKRYYAAKQLYHFVRPGAQRVGTSSDSGDLLVSAFRDASAGSLIVVGLKTGAPRRVTLALPAAVEAPPAWDLYLTTRNLDCQKVDQVAVRNGVAEFDLPDEAVFTLVGKLAK